MGKGGDNNVLTNVNLLIPPKRVIPCTVFAVGMALQRNPDVCEAMKKTTNWEIASHASNLPILGCALNLG